MENSAENPVLRIPLKSPLEITATKSLKHLCTVGCQVSDPKRMLRIVLCVTAKGGAIYQCMATGA